ncbi:helix-turn-helix domain-containing protein [Albimonas pacifica]|uniref:Transcriptional regulator, contains XRE-family HTH domain n=1 Tax=Albimonas pacifica TaxID=1114924 RepID=A0A1I3M0R2_9RHOB|nr:helix-turn-helix transcriptional regulator [Albimonas pacifica]SFI90553.1 Transcriptional regulator, contains XRE-family HTH domain [Albimonas pacifica]
MSLQYEEIGQRLRAFRLGSGLSAEEVAKRIGISRTALYRFEKGEVVKIETLTSLADLLGVSLATLLGVEIEYLSNAVTYFERLRQLEETADRIVVLAGPISFLLASERFAAMLEEILRETVAEDMPGRDKALADIARIIAILAERKEIYARRRPAIVNLISAVDVERMVRSGFAGRTFVREHVIAERRALARAELAHFASIIEAEPIGVQIGLVPGTLPHTGFQIFRAGDRKTLSISPFRLGEQPNVSLGVAMITSTQEAVTLHERVVDELWRRALKGKEAAAHMREIIAAAEGEGR